ncbi:type II methionyl aminopeptidase [Candidatus Woesearchaeota archaeon CG10_big_fil_rev_8_21_14_0_10_36_11]|nr:MAG: type II methionyl aminopeptidase [Candidatus Woesearchaeota archaeon CG10_big_fil_rev_8_21_14_0_10_36_11]
METETIQKYVKAGTIAAEALQYGTSLIKNGTKVITILDAIETKIQELGGELAFPAQISLNECAAHSCSDMNDETVLHDHVVKLDVGVHIDGYIADNAVTIDLSGKYTELVNASRDALSEALKIVTPGVSLAEIGNVIHKTITSYGFSPVRNLSGHGLGHYNIHTKPSIPNFDNGNKNTLKDGDVIAIEPFASTGAGIVQESVPATVFTLVKDAGVRDPITRKVLQEIKKYNGLPFAKRWLERTFGTPRTALALRTLVRVGCVQEHSPLVDQSRGIVSQAEHSVIVQKKPLVYTRRG